MSDDDPAIPDEAPQPEHLTGALMVSFGPVHVGREALAVDTFTAVSRFFGALLADGVVTSFKPYFFDGGQHGGMVGFWILEGHRERLDELRRDPDFQMLLLKASAASSNLAVNTLIAGTAAGRMVNAYRHIRDALGVLD